jgi:PAS domain S-box-containing protein
MSPLLAKRPSGLPPKHVLIACCAVFLAIVLGGLLTAITVFGAWGHQAALLFMGVLVTGIVAVLLTLWFAKHLRNEMQLDQSLHIVENNYQALINQPLAGVAKVDAKTGRYLAVNQRLCVMTGYTMQELLAMKIYDIIHPDDLERTKGYLTAIQESPVDVPQTFQRRYVHKGGGTVHAVISAHNVKNAQTGAIESIGLIQDISASIKSQTILKEQENRLSIIIHNSMDAIITIDVQENILIFNAAAETMFGYFAHDALKMPLSKLIPQSLRAGHHAHVQAFSQSGDTARKMGAKLVLKGLRSDGEEFPLDASISRAVSDGKTYMTVILRDLTKQVKAQNELDRARTELRELSMASQTAREEEKSRISRELHDELGQNLTALKMDLSWLQTHMSGEVAASLERIRAMQGVLDSTVVATRRIAADLRPMMLDDLGLKSALEWLTQDFARRLLISCNVLIDEKVIELDTRVQSALYRAVQECLTNISRHAQATQVDIELHLGSTEVTLQVRDNGVGMSDEARSKRGSFGLIGMRERIYILGGKVAINSQLGKGTHVTINLPRTPSTREISPTK